MQISVCDLCGQVRTVGRLEPLRIVVSVEDGAQSWRLDTGAIPPVGLGEDLRDATPREVCSTCRLSIGEIVIATLEDLVRSYIVKRAKEARGIAARRLEDALALKERA